MCSFYEKHILPYLTDWSLKPDIIGNLREELLKEANGNVLEIGIGTGLNLSYYPNHITHITATDVFKTKHRLVKKRELKTGVKVTYFPVNDETLPFPDNHFDFINTAFVLCTVKNPEILLKEIRRVLKPSGHYTFVEHGLSNKQSTQKWQHRLNGTQKCIAGGCNLNRDMFELISNHFEMKNTWSGTLKSIPSTIHIYKGVGIE